MPNGPPVQLALGHGEAGNLDEAFRHLDAAIAHRDPSLVHLAVAPQWDRLRGDERFGERLQAMGLAAAADRAQRFFQRTMAPRAATCLPSRRFKLLDDQLVKMQSAATALVSDESVCDGTVIRGAGNLQEHRGVRTHIAR